MLSFVILLQCSCLSLLNAEITDVCHYIYLAHFSRGFIKFGSIPFLLLLLVVCVCGHTCMCTCLCMYTYLYKYIYIHACVYVLGQDLM